MLTGDNEGTARAIAAHFGVDEYRAEFLSTEKVTVIERSIKQAEGIAMGAAGTDTAFETPEIALLSDDLTKLSYLLTLSQEATSVIEQNIWGSLGVKVLLSDWCSV